MKCLHANKLGVRCGNNAVEEGFCMCHLKGDPILRAFFKVKKWARRRRHKMSERNLESSA